MPSNPISRRDVLRTLAMGAVGGSVLQVIPLQAAEQVHHMVKKEKAQAPTGKYRPKSSPLTSTQRSALAMRMPSSHPMTNPEVRWRRARRNLSIFSPAKTKTISSRWEEGDVAGRLVHGSLRQPLSQLQRGSTKRDSGSNRVSQECRERREHQSGGGVLSFLRKLTTDGFYSSEIGIKDLQYIGNAFVKEFRGARLYPKHLRSGHDISKIPAVLPLEGRRSMA